MDEPSDPIQELVDLVNDAPPVPLTDEVRVDGGELRAALAGLAESAEWAVHPKAASKLAKLVKKARGVPLTDQVRIDRKKLLRLVSDLRSGPAG